VPLIHLPGPAPGDPEDYSDPSTDDRTGARALQLSSLDL
jgi:hypothetical protein